MTHLIILNDPPYGIERSYNGLRLAMALKKKNPDVTLNIFMIGDGVSCAVSGQKTPDGYYNLARMIRALLAKNVTMKCCGTCMDARGLSEESLISGVECGSMSDLAQWTAESDNVISF